MDITEKIVVHLGVSEVIHESVCSKTFDLKQRAKNVGERIHATTEEIEGLLRGRFWPRCTVEHPTLRPLLVLGRRQVGQAQEVFTLEMGAFNRKLLAAFFVDQHCDRVRKSASPWIFRSPRSDGVALNHPACSQLQG
jgi:hypothetical protein